MFDGDGGAGPLVGTPKEDFTYRVFIYPPGGPGGDIMSSEYVFIYYGSRKIALEK
ncbi:MAG: hypothetical protein CM15mV47_450 [uncultured marine virus]|nr:MAG: hypothetical protein CM15mV47_450 [uncultured marine virus]